MVELPDQPGYKLREDGQVWNPVRGHFMTPFLQQKGMGNPFRILEIERGGVRKRYRVHILLEQLLGIPYERYVQPTVERAPKPGRTMQLRPVRSGWQLHLLALVKKGVKFSDDVGKDLQPLVQDLFKWYPRTLRNIPAVIDAATLIGLGQLYAETIALCKEHEKKVLRASGQFYYDNPRIKSLNHARGRSGYLPGGFELTQEDILLPQNCPIMGVPLEYRYGEATKYSPSLDRIDPQKGYVVGNIQVISMLANQMKSNANPDQLRVFAENVLKLHG